MYWSIYKLCFCNGTKNYNLVHILWVILVVGYQLGDHIVFVFYVLNINVVFQVCKEMSAALIIHSFKKIK